MLCSNSNSNSNSSSLDTIFKIEILSFDAIPGFFFLFYVIVHHEVRLSRHFTRFLTNNKMSSDNE